MTRQELIEAIITERVFKDKGTFPYSRQRKVQNFLSTDADPVSKSVFRHVKRETNRPSRLGYTYIYDSNPIAIQDRGRLSRKKVNGEWKYSRTPGKKVIDKGPGFAINPIWQPKSLKFRS